MRGCHFAALYNYVWSLYNFFWTVLGPSVDEWKFAAWDVPFLRCAPLKLIFDRTKVAADFTMNASCIVLNILQIWAKTVQPFKSYSENSARKVPISDEISSENNATNINFIEIVATKTHIHFVVGPRNNFQIGPNSKTARMPHRWHVAGNHRFLACHAFPRAAAPGRA
jgi:hypothetical protein